MCEQTLSIPGYEVLEEIGSGANATVYRARHETLDRIDALKVLHPRLSANQSFVAKLQAEGRAAARLNHPHIVTVYDVMTTIPTPCLVMEYVEGGSLYDLLQQEGKLDQKLALRWVGHLAMALRTAHAESVVHCDIKPRNILIDRHGRAKLTDFGLARSIYSEVVRHKGPMGTPLYNSPEQIRGEADLDGRVDIYNLGATFYHMVTGRAPFIGNSPEAVMRQHLIEPAIPPDHLEPSLSVGVVRIIETMLAKDPAERYSSATELFEDLRCVSEGHSPRHAVDMSTIASLAQLEAKAKPQVVEIRKTIFTRPVLLALLAGSAIINVLLFLMLVLGR